MAQFTADRYRTGVTGAGVTGVTGARVTGAGVTGVTGAGVTGVTGVKDLSGATGPTRS
jgi:hypothetical protein